MRGADVGEEMRDPFSHFVSTDIAIFGGKQCSLLLYRHIEEMMENPTTFIILAILYTLTYLLDGLHGWRRVLVAAQIDHDPGDIAQESDGDGGTDERE